MCCAEPSKVKRILSRSKKRSQTHNTSLKNYSRRRCHHSDTPLFSLLFPIQLGGKNKWSFGEVGGSKKKKKKQQVITDELGQLSQQQKLNQTANWQLCRAALKG